MSRHLAEQGFDSLRYDKRGVGKSQGDFWSAGLFDNAADVKAAVEFVRAHETLSAGKVFLLGHSEGAYLAAKVAAQSPDLAGVVLLAGGARPCEEELRWQAAEIAKGFTGFNAFLIKLLRIDVLKAQAKQIEKIKRSTADWFRVQLVAKVNAKWMREFLDYDPADRPGAHHLPGAGHHRRERHPGVARQPGEDARPRQRLPSSRTWCPM